MGARKGGKGQGGKGRVIVIRGDREIDFDELGCQRWEGRCSARTGKAYFKKELE